MHLPQSAVSDGSVIDHFFYWHHLECPEVRMRGWNAKCFLTFPTPHWEKYPLVIAVARMWHAIPKSVFGVKPVNGVTVRVYPRIITSMTPRFKVMPIRQALEQLNDQILLGGL